MMDPVINPATMTHIKILIKKRLMNSNTNMLFSLTAAGSLVYHPRFVFSFQFITPHQGFGSVHDPQITRGVIGLSNSPGFLSNHELEGTISRVQDTQTSPKSRRLKIVKDSSPILKWIPSYRDFGLGCLAIVQL